MPFIMSPTIGKLAEALNRAQAQLEPATKNAVNPHLKNRYADLAACFDAARPALSANGLAITQLPGRRDDGTITLMTVLLHVSGEYLGEEAGVRLGQETPQTVGSAVTYLRRYALSSALGLSTSEDDDGHVSSAPAPVRVHEAREFAPAPAPASHGSSDPNCPTCGGRMWDNRSRKAEGTMSAKAPDYKCKDKECGGAIWPPRSGSSRPKPAAAPPAPDAELPDLEDTPF